MYMSHVPGCCMAKMCCQQTSLPFAFWLLSNVGPPSLPAIGGHISSLSGSFKRFSPLPGTRYQPYGALNGVRLSLAYIRRCGAVSRLSPERGGSLCSGQRELESQPASSLQSRPMSSDSMHTSLQEEGSS